MAKENEKELDLNAEFEDPEEILDEDGNDITDWKKLALENHGRLKRTMTDLKSYKTKEVEVAKKATEEAEKAKLKASESQDKKEFDLAEETYLLTKGIKESQFEMVLGELKSSGKTLKQLLESPYFKEKIEMANSADATPSGDKRGGGGANNEVDYWLTKGEYPPDIPENMELRRKVAAALAKRAENKLKFSPRPIV